MIYSPGTKAREIVRALGGSRRIGVILDSKLTGKASSCMTRSKPCSNDLSWYGWAKRRRAQLCCPIVRAQLSRYAQLAQIGSIVRFRHRALDQSGRQTDG